MPESTNSRIKVLQLGSPTGLYGAERWILALIRHVDLSRFDMQVAAFRDDPSLEVPLCTEAARLGFKAHIFEVTGRFNLSAVSKLREFIKKKGIHILHTHAYKQDIIGLLATRGTRCKVISTPHGWSREPDFKLWCYEMLNRAVFPFFDAVVPLSEDLYHPLKRFPGMKNRLHLIRNGVDISEIDAVTEVSPEIHRLRASGTFIIGYIGQLIHRKGLDVLLKAVGKLEDSLNWYLLIVGEGDLKNSLKDLARKLGISDRIHFLGFRKDRLALLKGFDVFVLPSRLEGIPRCLMEAMAANVPVIASDIPGCNDLIIDQETGILFPANDAQALAEKIEEIAANKTFRDTFSRVARGYVEQRFSGTRMADSYSHLYHLMVKESGDIK